MERGLHQFYSRETPPLCPDAAPNITTIQAERKLNTRRAAIKEDDNMKTT